MRTVRFVPVFVVVSPIFLGSVTVRAEEPGPAPAPGSVVVPSEGGEVVVTPGTTSTTTVYRPLGLPEPGTDINKGLPSSSRPINGDQSDGFDLGQSSSGAGVVYGTKGSAGVLDPSVTSASSGRAASIPDVHLVRHGDTLWDLSEHYYANPWQWPKIWAKNPQIQDPHWIYPGDQIKMRDFGALANARKSSRTLGEGGLGLRKPEVAPTTVFLRDQGYIGDPDKDVWGELIGAAEEQMLLADGNRVYLKLRSGVEVMPGHELTLFRSVRQPERIPGARKPPGEIVAILGTVHIDSVDPRTRIARARITESVNVIERGSKIGPVRRRFDIVPPRKNQKQVQARILTSLYPFVYFGQNQVVFIDRGSDDGLESGNTLHVLRRGDTWRSSLATASKMVRDRVRMDSPKQVDIETTPLRGKQKDFPDEVVAELRVLRAEKKSAIALVVHSRRELVPGDRALARPGS